LAFFPCFAPWAAANKRINVAGLEMQTGFPLISLIWSNYDMLGGQRLGIVISSVDFRLGFRFRFSFRFRYLPFLRSLPFAYSSALIATFFCTDNCYSDGYLMTPKSTHRPHVGRQVCFWGSHVRSLKKYCRTAGSISRRLSSIITLVRCPKHTWALNKLYCLSNGNLGDCLNRCQTNWWPQFVLASKMTRQLFCTLRKRSVWITYRMDLI